MTKAVLLDLGHEERIGFYILRERRQSIPYKRSNLDKGLEETMSKHYFELLSRLYWVEINFQVAE